MTDKTSNKGKCPISHLTTAFGAPVVDNQNSMTAGKRGPVLAQDVWLNEKLANFVREVIPERRMHAKGSGAFGTFTVTNDITSYTHASVFSEVGKTTDVQIMPEADAETYHVHPFDLTKIWYKADYPLIEVGEFELNRNPENYHMDVEQAAFSPSNLVPGISVSPDKMLQSRLINYPDSQRYRLGVNYQQVPVNAARCPVMSNHRDGTGRMDGNYGGLPHYQPNSFGQWKDQPEYSEPPLKIDKDAGRPSHRQAPCATRYWSARPLNTSMNVSG